jgi:flagellar protein FliO/FliZ
MKRMAFPRTACVLLAACAFSGTGFAASQTVTDPGSILYPHAPGPAEKPADAPVSGASTMILLVTVAGAAGGWLLWRRWRGGMGPSVRSEHRLSVAETRSLGNRQYLVVAAYGEKKFLIGVCPGRIDLLSPLESDEPRQ